MLELEKISLLPRKNIEILCNLILEIWQECLKDLLEKEILDYILSFVKVENLKNEIKSEKFQYYFIKKNGKHIGFLMTQYIKDFSILSRFFIKKNYRNKGYGFKIFKEIVEIFKENGSRKVYTSINKDNSNAIESFIKWGFKELNPVIRYLGSDYSIEEIKLEYNL